MSEISTVTNSKFAAYSTKHGDFVRQGFALKFANGICVSVAFGTGNYCDMGKNTAEVLAWRDSDNTDIVVPGFGDNTYVGHLSPEDVVKYLVAAAAI